jgi:hypothetical protein
MNARQGSLIERRRRPRMTISSGGPVNLNEFLTEEQIDAEIKMRSQKGKRMRRDQLFALSI